MVAERCRAKALQQRGERGGGGGQSQRALGQSVSRSISHEPSQSTRSLRLCTRSVELGHSQPFSPASQALFRDPSHFDHLGFQETNIQGNDCRCDAMRCDAIRFYFVCASRGWSIGPHDSTLLLMIADWRHLLWRCMARPLINLPKSSHHGQPNSIPSFWPTVNPSSLQSIRRQRHYNYNWVSPSVVCLSSPPPNGRPLCCSTALARALVQSRAFPPPAAHGHRPLSSRLFLAPPPPPGASRCVPEGSRAQEEDRVRGVFVFFF